MTAKEIHFCQIRKQDQANNDHNNETKNVGPLTKETTKLFGNNDDNVPTRTAVDNFVDKKLALTQ